MSTLQEKSRRTNSKIPSALVRESFLLTNKQNYLTLNTGENGLVKIKKSFSVDLRDSEIGINLDINKKTETFDSVFSLPTNDSETKNVLKNSKDLITDGQEIGNGTLTPLKYHRDNLSATFKTIDEELPEDPLESKTDIEEHVLKEEDLKSSRVNTKELLCEFLKSLTSPCDVCDDSSTQRVIKLNSQEQFAASFIVKKSFRLGLHRKKTLSKNIPKQTCGRCFTRIILFRNRLKKKFLERIIKEGATMESSYSHGYECCCVSCQNRYGQLRLIVRGIESLNPDSATEVLDPQPQIQEASPRDDILNLDRTRTLEHFQGQRNLHMHELQPVSQHMFHPEGMSSENISFSRQPDLTQPLHRIISQMHDFDNINNARTEISQQESSISVPFSQHHHRQQVFHTFSDFSSSTSQSLIESHTEKCEVDPNMQPSTSSGYHGHQQEEVYSEFCRSHSNIDERSILSNYQSSQSQEQKVSYTYSGSLDEGASILDSSSRESNLPVMLKEFEKRNQLCLSQPSTSKGFPRQYEEDPNSRRTKKICMHCKKQFTHTGDFKKHLRKHTKEKPYACKQCDKRFSHTSNLHRHERSHSGDRPYICEFCNKQFNRKDKLDSHKNSKSCKNKRKHGWK